MKYTKEKGMWIIMLVSLTGFFLATIYFIAEVKKIEVVYNDMTISMDMQFD